ncbi:hypothetical protein GCM10022284_02690 [Streptomyces hundungensis]
MPETREPTASPLTGGCDGAAGYGYQGPPFIGPPFTGPFMGPPFIGCPGYAPGCPPGT